MRAVKCKVIHKHQPSSMFQRYGAVLR